jgi:hypothetical protein
LLIAEVEQSIRAKPFPQDMPAHKRNVISESLANEIQTIRNLRNSLVHKPESVPPDGVRVWIEKLRHQVLQAIQKMKADNDWWEGPNPGADFSADVSRVTHQLRLRGGSAARSFADEIFCA